MKLSPRPTAIAALISLLAVTGCQSQASEEAAPAIPDNAADTVSEWWQALREDNVDRAMKLQAESLTDQYFSEDKLKTIANGVRSVEQCDISFSEPESVEGGEIVTADLTKCQFNKEISHWTWKVSSENGVLVQSDTGNTMRSATDRF